jgi:ribosomal protein L24E
MLGVLAAAAVLAVGAGTAQAHWCYETINPAGQPHLIVNSQGTILHFNGQSWLPYDGAAVPGGKDTTPGTNGHGPQNSDGFYIVNGSLWIGDGTKFEQLIYPDKSFAQWPDWKAETTIKFTQWSANKGIKITSMAGPNSHIDYQVQAWGDLYVKNDDGTYTFCGVPPPPF